MSEMSSKAKKLFDEFSYSQTVYHVFLASGMDNEYSEMKRKTRDAKRESFEEYVVGLESRIAELESLVEQLIWVGNDLLVSNTNPVTITLFNGLVCNAKEREQ